MIQRGDQVIVITQREGEDPIARAAIYAGDSLTRDEHVRVTFPDGQFVHTFHATRVFVTVVDAMAALVDLE